MARNFKIQINGTDQTFFFDLIGDFDGSSAFELLNLLEEKLRSPKHKACINTSRLKRIHPFGREVFARNFASVTYMGNVVFTGASALELSPVEKTTIQWPQDIRKQLPFVDRFDASRSGRSQQPAAGGE